MADSIDLSLNINNSLQETLTKTTQSMNRFNGLLDQAVKNMDFASKKTEIINDHFDDIEESQIAITKQTQMWSKALGGIGGILKKVVAGAAAFIPSLGFASAVKQTFELDTAMRQLSFRMGDMGTTTEQFKKAVFETTEAVGISTEAASELIGTLGRLRVPADRIEELNISTAQFQRITGATADNAARLTGELVRTGRMGNKEIQGILNSVVQVQRNFGLAEEEVNALSETIVYSTKMLNQMGKSAADIQSFNKGVSKLAAAFTSVGIEASEANKFVEELLDPSRVEDNALLYARLGVSLEDAFAGDVDPGMLASRFKELGQELKGMSGPAAAAMAQSLGMPLGQLRQMAEMDLSEIEASLSGAADPASALAEANQEQLSAQEKMENTMNRVGSMITEMTNKLMPLFNSLAGFIENFGMKFQDILTDKIPAWIQKNLIPFFKDKIPNLLKKLAPFLIAGIIGAFIVFKKLRERFFSVSTEVKKNLTTAITEAMDQGSARGAEIMSQRAVNASSRPSARAEDRQARVEASPGFEAMLKKAEYFKNLAKDNILPAMKNVNLATAQMYENLANGAKPISRMEEATRRNYENIANNLNVIKEQQTVREEMLKASRQEIEFAIEQNQTRINYLNTIERNAEQERELLKLSKQNKALDKERGKLGSELAQQESRFADRIAKQRERLSEDQLRAIKTELDERRRLANSNIENIKQQREESRQNLALIEKELENNSLSYFERKKLTAEQARITQEVIQQNEEYKQQRKIVDSVTDEIASIDKIKPLDIGAGTERKWKSFFAKTGDFMKSNFAKAGDALSNKFDAIKESARQIGRNLAARINPRNIVAGFRQRREGRRVEREQERERRRGMTRQERRAERGGGFLGKMMGPLGMIVGLLSRLEPVQEFMGKIMEKIKPFLEQMAQAVMPLFDKLLASLTPFIEKMMPIIKGAFEKLVEFLMPLLDQLVEFLMPLIESLLPAIQGILKNVVMPLLEAIMGVLMPVIQAIMPLLSDLLDKVLMPLVKALMPPLLDLLGIILDVWAKLIEGIGKMLGPFGKGLVELGKGLGDASDAMRESASEMRKSNAQERVNNQMLEVQNNMMEKSNELGIDLAEIQQGDTKLTLEQSEELRSTMLEQVDALERQIALQQKQIFKDELSDLSEALKEEGIKRNSSEEEIRAVIDSLIAKGELSEDFSNLQFDSGRDFINLLGGARGGNAILRKTEGGEGIIADRTASAMEEAVKNTFGMTMGDIDALRTATGDDLREGMAEVLTAQNRLAQVRAEEEARAIAEREAARQRNESLENINSEIQEGNDELADSIAEGMERTIRTEWEPAQLRASEEGIEVERKMAENTIISEQRTQTAVTEAADASNRTAEELAAQRETQVALSEEQKEREERIASEQSTTNQLLRELISAINARGI